MAQAVIAVAAVVALLFFFRSVLAPFCLASLMAVVGFALADVIEERLPGAPHWLVIVLASVVLNLLLVAGLVVEFHGAADLVAQSQQLPGRLQDALHAVSSSLGIEPAPDLKSLVARIDLPAVVQAALASVSSTLSAAGLVMLFLVFLLASRLGLQAKIAMTASASPRPARFMAVLDQVNAGVRAYVVMQAAASALIAVASGAVLFAIGLQDALFWAVAIFAVSYIPVIGSLIGSIAPALFALVQFPTVAPALAIFVAIQAIYLVVGNVVVPKMQAASQNIDPVAGILAFSIWSLLWGIPGAILAAPLTFALMLTLAQFEPTRWLAVLISNDGKPGGEATDIAPSADAGSP